MRFDKKKLFAILSMIFIFTSIQAQNQTLIKLAQSEIEKRGLTELEVRTRLSEEGINIESISPAEYPKYQKQIISILNEMQNEKSQLKEVSVNESNLNNENTSLSEKLKSNSEILNIPKTTPEEYIAEAEQRELQSDANKNEENTSIYGHSMFTNKSLDLFRTTDGAEAPETYVLGVGDEIRISIFGTSQTDIQQKVLDDGSIQPTGLSKIFVKGLTLKQARSYIRKRLSNYYDFRPDQLVIRIDGARTITINIFGEVHTQGSFNLSALNSAFNALSASGGPTQYGSLRKIQWIRGQQKSRLDLYEFMNDPSKSIDLALQTNDILFVPIADNIVSIEGAVKRPMKYEVLENESLIDLIRIAGGITADAKRDYVQITRIVNGEEKLFEHDLNQILNGILKIELLNGDRIKIRSINRPIANYVDIDGAVYYGGRFDLQSNPQLSDLLKNAQPTYNAKTDIVFIERLRPDLTIEYINLPYSEDIDYKLQPRDKVHILDLQSYRDIETITVNGAVRKPFARTISFKDEYTIAQAIDLAGGLIPTANKRGYVFRKNWNNPEQTTYIPVDLVSDLSMKLRAGDRLNIYDETTFTDFGNIRISGAVRSPQNLSYDPSLNLHDLIIEAGGFNVGAAYNQVQVFRVELSTTNSVNINTITLEVDKNYQLIKPREFQFQPYDHVVVRMTPEFNFGYKVELNGQVKYPGIYVIDNKNSTLTDVITKAGGLLENADVNGSTLFRTYNERGNILFHLEKAIEHKNDKKFNPLLFDGDVININRLENTVTIHENATRMNQYALETGNKTLEIIFQGKKSAKWYVKNFAGGFQKNANKRSITVKLPNNKVIGTHKFLGFNVYPKVEPGSEIALMMDNKKERKLLEPKEKIDLETTLSKALSTLTSVLSIVLLAGRL